MGEAHARAFEEPAFLENTGDTAAAGRPLPDVPAEIGAVQRSKTRDDSLLQASEEPFDCREIHERAGYVFTAGGASEGLPPPVLAAGFAAFARDPRGSRP